MHRHIAVFFFRPFEHGKFGNPQNVVNVLVYKPELFGEHSAQSAQGVEHNIVFIGGNEQNVALFKACYGFNALDIFGF